MEAYRCILLEPPLMGKSRDRGAREPIKPITPTFVLPRRGEGQRALPPVGFFVSRPIVQAQNQFSKEDAKSTKFMIKNIQTLRVLRDLRGE
jgi:hypothetical protein